MTITAWQINDAFCFPCLTSSVPATFCFVLAFITPQIHLFPPPRRTFNCFWNCSFYLAFESSSHRLSHLSLTPLGSYAMASVSWKCSRTILDVLFSSRVCSAFDQNVSRYLLTRCFSQPSFWKAKIEEPKTKQSV